MSQPAVTSYDEFSSFDYSTLYADDKFYSLFMHPKVPVVSVILYLLLSNVVFKTIKNVFDLAPKGPVVQTITICHSAALAVYSGWTAYYGWQIFGPHLLKHGLQATLCDADGELWGKLGWWVTHFYISKYYEFIDTWIVLLKGRDPIFLQVYHHAGIVLIMWGFVVTQCTGGGVVILVLNSFIHTIMYTYYLFAAFGYSSPLKHYLTQAQLTQFFLGVGVTVPLYWQEGCLNEAQALSLKAIHVYTIYLIYLFGKFYYDSYVKKKDKKSAKKA
mmetsp:Transcript_8247/g.13991  ORF Transcript_8247/g.13991 Transcript_8247/m.13991 type:complete len:273 (-) Transcript_8247:1420-2238(-)|eukprot:CAMPEP_0114428860 /NCGR_PEP_ID=MMETSP0103-20121206/9167_1 /TAXON_ID=37642 ORGANISM="Paraphysomonas imperforata, Strain PA2" /NCGR_SAMPLE_ID=MMETSP0103 /ASSEMBLY_ACC=CAM_ASM_000201 /LENGTH=272 /DNA_ID=CAMNT_0001598137 /DNA_START=29 /DNA_END=847 /DNA_ORIENTATION=-